MVKLCISKDVELVSTVCDHTFLPFLVILRDIFLSVYSYPPPHCIKPSYVEFVYSTCIPAMPSIVRMYGNPAHAQGSSGVVKFTNCLQVKGNNLIKDDLWVSSISGKILNGQQILYEHRIAPEQIVDLGGRILSPGLIDTQLNGAYGFDFSVIPNEGAATYGKGVLRVNKNLVATGVTSYLPTLTSQMSEVYQKVAEGRIPEQTSC